MSDVLLNFRRLYKDHKSKKNVLPRPLLISLGDSLFSVAETLIKADTYDVSEAFYFMSYDIWAELIQISIMKHIKKLSTKAIKKLIKDNWFLFKSQAKAIGQMVFSILLGSRIIKKQDVGKRKKKLNHNYFVKYYDLYDSEIQTLLKRKGGFFCPIAKTPIIKGSKITITYRISPKLIFKENENLSCLGGFDEIIAEKIKSHLIIFNYINVFSKKGDEIGESTIEHVFDALIYKITKIY